MPKGMQALKLDDLENVIGGVEYNSNLENAQLNQKLYREELIANSNSADNQQ